MISQDFQKQLAGYGLTTAQILYWLPDHRNILQSYVWQEYDLSPQYPTLHKFIEFWKREIEGPLHSVTVTHCRLIKPSDFQVGRVFNLH